jgi:hypothetical protein
MLNKILYTDLTNVTYTSTATGSTDFTVEALNNYIPSNRWVGNIGSNNVLTITFPSPKECNCIIIENHNLKHFANVTLNTTGYSLNLDTDSDDTIYLEFDNSVTQQVWTITIPSASADMSPYIGNIFLDKLLTFNIPPQAGFKVGNTDSRNTNRYNLRGTIRNAGTKDTKFVAELNFPFVADQMKIDFVQFFKTCGKNIPFYFIDSDRNVKYMLVEGNYQPIQIMKYRWNQLLNFKMRSFDMSNAYIKVPIEMIPTEFYVTSVT